MLRRSVLFWLLLLLLCGAGGAGLHSAESRQLIDDFSTGLNPHWREKEFSGHTRYRIETEADGNAVLAADSQAAASALIFTKKYRLQDFPFLAWRWKIAATLSSGDAKRRSGDDYPARIYVVFPHWNPLRTRSINYIWANRLPQGSFLASSYTENSLMIAVQSGLAQAGRWQSERRNVLEDYRRAFAEEPPAVGAIAIMTDSDNTGEHAQGWYDDLWIERNR